MEVVGFKASLSSDVVNRKKDTDNVTTIDYHTIYWRSITQVVQRSYTVRLSVIGPEQLWRVLLADMTYRFHTPSLLHSITLVGPIADSTKFPA